MTHKALTQNDVLYLIFKLLDGKVLKNLRLVCQAWNTVALQLFQKKLKLSIRKLEALELEEIVTTLTPEIFSSVAFADHFGRSESTCYDVKQVLPRVPNPELVRTLIVADREAEDVVSCINAGLLPNLTELKLAGPSESQDQCKGQYKELCRQGSLASLKELTIKREFCKPPASRFYQSLLKAAPNLVKLRCWRLMDLTKQTKLEELSLRKTWKYRFNQGKLLRMMEGVRHSLKVLEIVGVQFTFQLPAFTKLSKLHLESNISESVLHFKFCFPNLRILSVCAGLTMKDEMIQQILRNKPASLKVLEVRVRCNLDHETPSHTHYWMQDTLKALPSLAPDLKLLKIKGSCFLNGYGGSFNEDWHLMMKCFLSLGFPNLTLDCESKVSLTHILDCISALDDQQEKEFNRLLGIPEDPVEREAAAQSATANRNCVLRFQNGKDFPMFLCSQKDDEKELSGFNDWMARLLEKWGRVEFRGYNVRKDLKEKIQADITSAGLQVEIYES